MNPNVDTPLTFKFVTEAIPPITLVDTPEEIAYNALLTTPSNVP